MVDGGGGRAAPAGDSSFIPVRNRIWREASLCRAEPSAGAERSALGGRISTADPSRAPAHPLAARRPASAGDRAGGQPATRPGCVAAGRSCGQRRRRPVAGATGPAGHGRCLGPGRQLGDPELAAGRCRVQQGGHRGGDQDTNPRHQSNPQVCGVGGPSVATKPPPPGRAELACRGQEHLSPNTSSARGAAPAQANSEGWMSALATPHSGVLGGRPRPAGLSPALASGQAPAGADTRRPPRPCPADPEAG